jgi:lycopene beta-cyclase
MTSQLDFAIVGGGLQAGLIALAVRAQQPRARIAIVERGPALGGNHTWCFHAGDRPGGSAWSTWIDPLVVARWDSYEVAFPGRRRQLASPYACVTSARLDTCARAAVDELFLGEAVHAIEPHRIATSAREVEATVVIDARGPDRIEATPTGWQTFVGQEVRVPGHGLARPIVMDATVDQRGAYTFMYVLPLAPDVLLVEDTAFADRAYLDVAAGRAAIATYLERRGWATRGAPEVLREETGVLPLPLALAPPSPTGSPLVAGYAGGWFHPVTGYSFPVAARLAAAIASAPPADLFSPRGPLAALARAHAGQVAFATRLNRMLFRWFAPEQRYHVLERFYGLPEPLIRRFYALETTALDRARIFVGRPPRGLSWRAMLRRPAAPAIPRPSPPGPGAVVPPQRSA